MTTIRRMAVAGASGVLLATLATPAGADQARPAPGTHTAGTQSAGVQSTTLSANQVPTGLTISGRGYGHGRGMGQYGALGHATQSGWSHATILGHFYAGTRMGSVGNPAISVELMSWSGGSQVAVTGSSLVLNGRAIGANAAKFVKGANGRFMVYTASSCSGPWKAWSASAGASVVSRANAANPSTYVQTCGTTGTRGYRGNLWVGTNSAGSMRVVNRVHLDTYLRGVLPREMPASWANAGGGRGMQALKAQAVAARSYAMASKRSAVAQTCDTIACQVYGGAFWRTYGGSVKWMDDARTDAAVASTSGQVRRTSSGRLARTEFSSSTGGWTAGGDFRAVRDTGDAVGSNPHQNWSTSLTWAQVESKIGRGKLASLTVTKRNGLGADGGRVLQVTGKTSTGSTFTLTGGQVRQRFGLRSNWFTLTPQQPATRPGTNGA